MKLHSRIARMPWERNDPSALICGRNSANLPKTSLITREELKAMIVAFNEKVQAGEIVPATGKAETFRDVRVCKSCWEKSAWNPEWRTDPFKAMQAWSGAHSLDFTADNARALAELRAMMTVLAEHRGQLEEAAQREESLIHLAGPVPRPWMMGPGVLR